MLYFFYTLFASVLLFTLPTQASLYVSPLVMDFTTPKGEAETAIIEVENTSKDPITVKIYKKDFKMEPNGQEVELEPGILQRGCAEWLTISPMGLIDITPGEKILLKATLTVPREASGTYWSKVFVEQSSKPKPIKESQGGVNMAIFIRQRWEIRVHEFTPGIQEKSGDIVDMNVSLPIEESPLSLTLDFENFGDTLLRCQGNLEIRNEDGEKIVSLPLPDNSPYFSVYPGVTRQFSKEIKTPLAKGEYIALAIIDYEEEDLIHGAYEFTIE